MTPEDETLINELLEWASIGVVGNNLRHPTLLVTAAKRLRELTRAHPAGQMKSAEEWVEDFMKLINYPPIYKVGSPNVDVEQLQCELGSLIERIQADALAAQPPSAGHADLIPDATLKNASRMYNGLRGQIFGDRTKRFEDGMPIMTSQIIEELGNGLFRTRNSLYKVEFINERDDTHPALLPSSAGHADWVLVPREPTEEMIEAMRTIDNGKGYAVNVYPIGKSQYTAMLSAAPEPPSGQLVPTQSTETGKSAEEWVRWYIFDETKYGLRASFSPEALQKAFELVQKDARSAPPEPRNGWQAIESAARDGEAKILLGAYHGGEWYVVLGRNVRTNIPCGFRKYVQPTHWQTLPAPPQVKS